MAAQSMMNGVSTDELEKTVESIRDHPELGKCKFRAHNEWLDGGNNHVRVKDFYAAGQEVTSRAKAFDFDADEPPLLLGHDRGANPVEYLLTALSACMTTSMVYHAAANGIKIEELESDFEGDLDLQGFLGLADDVRPGYQQIRATFRVRCDAPTEKLGEFLKRSPVYDVVSKSVPVVVNIEKM
ncbi:OsmC family protein [Verrucomicrobiota bacterium sgz303538]